MTTQADLDRATLALRRANRALEDLQWRQDAGKPVSKVSLREAIQTFEDCCAHRANVRELLEHQNRSTAA